MWNVYLIIGGPAAYQAVGLDVGGDCVDAAAEALVHDVHVAAELTAVVRLAHVPVMVVPAGALLGQLEETIVPRWDEKLWEEERREKQPLAIKVETHGQDFAASNVFEQQARFEWFAKSFKKLFCLCGDHRTQCYRPAL